MSIEYSVFGVNNPFKDYKCKRKEYLIDKYIHVDDIKTLKLRKDFVKLKVFLGENHGCHFFDGRVLNKKVVNYMNLYSFFNELDLSIKVEKYRQIYSFDGLSFEFCSFDIPSLELKDTRLAIVGNKKLEIEQILKWKKKLDLTKENTSWSDYLLSNIN